MPLPHEVLGIAPDASPKEVRAAFRRFVRHHHPDRGGDAHSFRAGVEAYERLLGASSSSMASAHVVFHRRRRGLDALAAPWRARRERRRRPARVR